MRDGHKEELLSSRYCSLLSSPSNLIWLALPMALKFSLCRRWWVIQCRFKVPPGEDGTRGNWHRQCCSLRELLHSS
uniref:Uncharacterized protein n=1 Tax=Arundo donax TaxID=35708 RepID=A0A0A9EBG2_ARUDO